MKKSFENGRLLLYRSPEDRKPLNERLNRIEGQVRGVKAMIENDRYCGDELYQIKAAIAALRAVAMMLAEQHVAAGAELLSSMKLKDDAKKDIARVFGKALDL